MIFVGRRELCSIKDAALMPSLASNKASFCASGFVLSQPLSSKLPAQLSLPVVAERKLLGPVEAVTWDTQVMREDQT